jgi:flavin-dependent dehydrogenase
MAAAVLLRNSFLKERLARLQPVEGTFCAVAGVSLARKGTFADDVCLVGDAAQMIAPFCGDGMGMALRASSIATPLCSLFLAGEISRRAFLQKYTNQWNEEFGMRIKLGQALQTVAMWPHGADIALCLVGLAPAAGDWLIRHTRMIVRKNAAAQH